MKKLAIIGASYLQEPLITKAKERGIETHVFAWECGDVGEKIADYFYPISIVEKENILDKCKEIKIDGICSIASDLAMVTVNFVAQKMGLSSNTLECTKVSTNKHEMRKCFEKNGDPSPKSILVNNIYDLENKNLSYPLIVKPLDRSGSRGITKIERWDELERAIKHAQEQGFEKKALVEEFARGKEYSVECISWQGKHCFLAMTEKFTTGSPNFVEVGHIQPADVTDETLTKVKNVVVHALDSLQVTMGASHSEIKIDENGKIKIIEIGARMGGDFIGSNLVQLSTGVDFVGCVIDCALGMKPNISFDNEKRFAAVRFAMNVDECKKIQQYVNKNEDKIVQWEINENKAETVTDSSNRMGYCLATFEKREDAVCLVNMK